MKKIAAICLPVLLILALAFPAFATEYAGNTIELLRAEIENEDVKECIVLTSVPQAEAKSTDIKQEARDQLIEVFAALADGSMKLPVKGEYRYLEFADISFAETTCVQAENSSADAGHQAKRDLLHDTDAELTLTFKLDGAPQGEILVLEYIDEKWEILDYFLDNGNGEIVCTFEDVCIAAIIQFVGSGSGLSGEMSEETSAGQTTSGKNFVPSITYKDGLEITEADTNMKDDNGNSWGTGIEECLIVTSIEQAIEKSTDISQSERDLLLQVYNALAKGEMMLPLDGDYVIRDLIDVSFQYNDCRLVKDHGNKEEKLAIEGNTLTVTFAMDVPTDVPVRVLAYVNGKWGAIHGVKNNGDGTVTCIFEDVGPVAFVVDEFASGDVTQTTDSLAQDVWKWLGVMALCVGGIAGLLLIKRKKAA